MKKGLFIVFTGKGKGKTTAALGMAIRAAGHDMNVLILQFIKGAWTSGELAALERFENITIEPLGSGFTWHKKDLAEDRELAQEGWKRAEEEIRSGRRDLIILDELNIVLSYGFIPVEQVLETINTRPPHVHVVVTGRDAPKELIESADLVTEMHLIKHPYGSQGIKAQKGIEF